MYEFRAAQSERHQLKEEVALISIFFIQIGYQIKLCVTTTCVLAIVYQKSLTLCYSITSCKFYFLLNPFFQEVINAWAYRHVLSHLFRDVLGQALNYAYMWFNIDKVLWACECLLLKLHEHLNETSLVIERQKST